MAGPRNKRIAEEMARASLNGENDHSSKKRRFDARNPSTLAPEAEDEDQILELDEIGKGGLQSKRNAVRLEGYESDSSNENFDARAAAKAEVEGKGKRKDAKSKDEEDNDMFADLEEEDGDDDEELAKEGKKRKEVRFMEDNEIEGQVKNSKSGGHVSADFTLDNKRKDDEVESSSDSGDDEERDKAADDQDDELGAGAKKRHAPKLDAFNMREENQEGRFDESGNYVRNAIDPHAVHDMWMEGTSKSEMKKAREAQEKREADRRKRDIADDSLSMGELLSTLITRMEKGESVLETLARLGRAKEKKKPRWQKNRRKGEQDSMDVDAKQEDAAETTRREMVDAITAAADQILTRGQSEIYEAEREMLIRQYRRDTGEEWIEPARMEDGGAPEVKQWEYRWSDARDGGDSHGPFDGETMQAWNSAGFFDEGVEFKQVGTEGWSRAVDFV